MAKIKANIKKNKKLSSTKKGHKKEKTKLPEKLVKYLQSAGIDHVFLCFFALNLEFFHKIREFP